jgi:TldD protein
LDEKFLDLSLETAQKLDNVTYVDVKYLKRTNESLTVKNDLLEQSSRGSNSGMGIRVIAEGAWGFAATNVVNNDNVKLIAEKAVRIARASARAQKFPVKLAEEPTHEAKWVTSLKKDPFDVSLEEKIELLIDSNKSANLEDERIKARNSFYNAWKDQMVLWTSEGTRIDQTITICGGGVSTVVVDGGEAYTRTIPSSFRGNFSTAGYEFVEELNLISIAKKASEEALQIIEAPKCPSITTSIILLPAQLMLQIHESCGHPTELDRALDYEAAYAGTSFLKPNKLEENFQYGNELVTLVADATTLRGSGNFGFDHEGVIAQRTLLVDKGEFKGFMSSRETAHQIGLDRSSGAMRADVWNHIPLIRMTNVSLEPGDWDYDELIAETKKGIIMDTNKSWSIDDLRLNFQFSTEIGWLVEDGEIKHVIKAPSYQGTTPSFWNSCSGITKDKFWKIMGTPNCGKGEPVQVIHTGHGSSPARFENVKIGVQ